MKPFKELDRPDAQPTKRRMPSGVRSILLAGLLGAVLLAACDKKAELPPPTPPKPPTPALVEKESTTVAPNSLATPVGAVAAPTLIVTTDHPQTAPETSTPTPNSAPTAEPTPTPEATLGPPTIQVILTEEKATMMAELVAAPPAMLLAVNDLERVSALIGGSTLRTDKVPDDWTDVILSLSSGSPSKVAFQPEASMSGPVRNLFDHQGYDSYAAETTVFPQLDLTFTLGEGKVVIGTLFTSFDGVPMHYDADSDTLTMIVYPVDISPRSLRDDKTDAESWVLMYTFHDVSQFDLTFAPAEPDSTDAGDLIGKAIDANQRISARSSFTGRFAPEFVVLPTGSGRSMERRDPPVLTLRTGVSAELLVSVLAVRFQGDTIVANDTGRFPFAVGTHPDSTIGILTHDPTALLSFQASANSLDVQKSMWPGLLYSAQEVIELLELESKQQEWVQQLSSSSEDYKFLFGNELEEETFERVKTLYSLFVDLEALSYLDQKALLEELEHEYSTEEQQLIANLLQLPVLKDPRRSESRDDIVTIKRLVRLLVAEHQKLEPGQIVHAQLGPDGVIALVAR